MIALLPLRRVIATVVGLAWLTFLLGVVASQPGTPPVVRSDIEHFLHSLPGAQYLDERNQLEAAAANHLIPLVPPGANSSYSLTNELLADNATQDGPLTSASILQAVLGGGDSGLVGSQGTNGGEVDWTSLGWACRGNGTTCTVDPRSSPPADAIILGSEALGLTPVLLPVGSLPISASVSPSSTFSTSAWECMATSSKDCTDTGPLTTHTHCSSIGTFLSAIGEPPPSIWRCSITIRMGSALIGSTNITGGSYDNPTPSIETTANATLNATQASQREADAGTALNDTIEAGGDASRQSGETIVPTIEWSGGYPTAVYP